MTKKEKAVFLRERGLSVADIAAAIESTPGSVKALLWQHDNPEKRRVLNRESMARHRDPSRAPKPDAIRDWWAARA